MGIERNRPRSELFDEATLAVDVLGRADAFINSTVESLVGNVEGDETVVHAAIAAVNSESLRRRAISRQSVAAARVAYEVLMAILEKVSPGVTPSVNLERIPEDIRQKQAEYTASLMEWMRAQQTGKPNEDTS